MKSQNLEKFLIIQTASIGDVVLATALITKLKLFYPEAKIDFLLKKGNESLLSNFPGVRKVLCWNKSSGKFKEWLRLLRFIRSEKYDVVINIQRFASTGLLTALSGARIKLGFKKNPFSIFFTHALPHKISSDPSQSDHEIYRNLSLIDIITDSSRNYPVRLYPAESDFDRVKKYKSAPYITISPSSLWFTKQWPAEKWIEFLQHVNDQWNVYLLGSAQDISVCQSIVRDSAHPGAVNLAGELSFLETAALMRDAVMNYVNDSAPLHFCSAMNAPVTAIFCSTVPAFGFGPLSERSYLVETDEFLDCRPCGLHGKKSCPEKHFQCAYGIKVEKLLVSLRESINQTKS